MSNLILMLALLGVPLAAAALLGRWTEWHRAAGAAGLAMVFLMTGSGHFFLTDLLAQMIPRFSRSGNSWSWRPACWSLPSPLDCWSRAFAGYQPWRP